MRYPLSLFVGRENEARQLLTAIGSSASSRQAVAGAPGVGKTTLVQWVKAEALRAGYWATDDLVSLYPNDTAELLIGRILNNIYEAAVAARPAAADNAVLQDAKQLVRVARLTSGGGGVGALGFSASMSRSHSAVTPTGALLLDGPRVIHDLLTFSRDAGARGIVVHANNLENLSERDTAAAADVLRSIRDTVLLQPGLHLIAVGTTDAVAAVTGGHPQLRSIFATPLLLDPMTPTAIDLLLGARYAHLALDRTQSVTSPVTSGAVRSLARVFRGDLRGLLKALEEGTSMLLGIGRGAPGTPLTEREVLPVLQQRYSQLLAAELDPRRIELLKRWAAVDRVSEHTQESLQRLWRYKSQGAVSKALRDLIGSGYVEPLPRRGASPMKYVLTGASRLVFD